MFRRSLLPVATAAAAALVLLSVGCAAQDNQDCMNRPVVKDFNASAYMGKWYEYGKYGYMPFEQGGICVMAEYTLRDDNITVVNSKKDNTTQEVTSITGWAEFASDQKEAKLKVHFPGSPVEGNYWVLSTDYNNYAIVWSCAKRPDSTAATETSWILVRAKTPSNMTLEKVDQELRMLGLSMDKYMKTECSGASHLFGAVLSVILAMVFALLH